MQLCFVLRSHTVQPVFERSRRWDFHQQISFPVSHQRGVSGSAGLRRDLDLSSVYHSSISLVPFLPLAVRLMMCRVRPKGRPAPGTIQSRNWGDSSSSPCLKMKKQKGLDLIGCPQLDRDWESCSSAFKSNCSRGRRGEMRSQRNIGGVGGGSEGRWLCSQQNRIPQSGGERVWWERVWCWDINGKTGKWPCIMIEYKRTSCFKCKWKERGKGARREDQWIMKDGARWPDPFTTSRDHTLAECLVLKE